jgi:isoleucyl-tRNA synthetase
VIFLATSQWFIRMDGEDAVEKRVGASEAAVSSAEAVGTRATLRAAALDQIDHHVKWIPTWGRDRIYNMVANRPDWCISRQRAWGVPIPALDCSTCGEALVSPAIVERAATVFEKFGADAWYERPADEFVPPGLTCPSCGGGTFEREMNILDVWFDSGSSHEAVLSVRPELTWPADIYLEGSDQHRGWFQSSLLVGLGTRGRAPYREVLTHGFIVADDGRKMSKSLGNTILPQDIIKQSGADILRLWVSMSDYTQEIRAGKEVMARAVEAYRKIRNTMRYLAANLYDFDPAVDQVRLDHLEEVDRYLLARYGELVTKILAAYESYEYGTIFQALNGFATVDLSAFYADVSKDRLYTFAARSRERRSAQTAMYLMADGLTRLMAPILSFTADELWRRLPGARDESVHMAEFPSAQSVSGWSDHALTMRWDTLSKLRERVLAEIEPLRKNKQIGSSLQAKVILTATPAELAPLERMAADLPMVFIVSEVELRSADVDRSGEPQPRIEISRAGGVKCERCWRYVPSVSVEPEWAGLCSRCQDALAGPSHG